MWLMGYGPEGSDSTKETGRTSRHRTARLPADLPCAMQSFRIVDHVFRCLSSSHSRLTPLCSSTNVRLNCPPSCLPIRTDSLVCCVLVLVVAMASVYTTKRGKNKKQKLGNRKDASNNAANKLNTTVAKSLLETILDGQPDKKILTLGSSEQRRKTAILKAQEKLQLTAASTATTAAEGAEGDERKAESDGSAPAAAVAAALASLSLSSQPELPDVRLDVCHFSACLHKRNVEADEDKEKDAAESEVSGSSSTSSARLLLCGGCRCVSYCSAACQKTDWPTHKVACKKWQAAKAAQQATTQSASSSSSSSSDESSTSAASLAAVG